MEAITRQGTSYLTLEHSELTVSFSGAWFAGSVRVAELEMEPRLNQGSTISVLTTTTDIRQRFAKYGVTCMH